MNQEQIEALHVRIPVKERLPPFSNIEKGKKQSKILKKILSFLPFLNWLPKYKWKEDLKYDIIAGLTVGIMVVPQGMAYASLAGIPPVYGLYASFFAPIIYTFFGTSKHISVGVFAVGSMMVGNVKLRFAPDDIERTWYENGTLRKGISRVLGEVDFGFEYNAMDLLSSLTLTVGIVQIIMALFRLGFITTYMTDQLLSGFTTGSACHVLMSQLNKILGVPMPRHSGVGMLLRMLGDIILEIPNTNLTTFALSLCSLTFLIISHTFIGPYFKRKFSFPLPFELVLVIITTLCSQIFDINEKNDVKIVKYVPIGIPEPSLPNIIFVPYLIADAISIAIICYMFVVSMGMLFAKKHGYRTDPTQEMYALGFMNLFGSLFPVYPSGASLSRSSVCEMNGVRTQLVNFFICAVLLVVILWLGPFLEPLPLVKNTLFLVFI
uniref:SLC26A/SulP transporter domain-containing protein n=2 Tax=Panagrolaimus superbus TaxID=310955 RepID=A0A914YL85_9BILA